MSDSQVAAVAMPLRDDNPSDIDLLGFEDVVEVVEEIVTRADLDPVTVGVNAPWGGGKTTVLQLLKRRLDARDDVFCSLVSRWEYDNKTDPTTALIDEVLGALQMKLENAKGFGDKAKETLGKLRRRVKFFKAMKLAATSALTTTIPGVGALIDLFDDGNAQENVPPDPTLQGFHAQFAEAMESDDLTPLRRVVVLVDDLDRSLPDTVVETLHRGNGQSIWQIWWPPPRSSRGRQRSVLWPSRFRISWPLTVLQPEAVALAAQLLEPVEYEATEVHQHKAATAA